MRTLPALSDGDGHSPYYQRLKEAFRPRGVRPQDREDVLHGALSELLKKLCPQCKRQLEKLFEEGCNESAKGEPCVGEKIVAVTVNRRSVDQVRRDARNRRRGPVGLKGDSPEPPDTRTGDVFSYLDGLASAECLEKLSRALLEVLTEEERRVVLRICRSETMRSVAAALDTSPATVHSTWKGALAKLRNELHRCCGAVLLGMK